METHLKFWKVESIGNHFPLFVQADIFAVAQQFGLAVEELLPALARFAAKPHFGIGGDGILVVDWDEKSLKMRMFNPDGSEDFCGNGIRCAVKFARHQGWASGSFSVAHRGSVVSVWVTGDEISTQIPPASYDPKLVPTSIAGELFGDTVFAGRDGNWSVVLTGSALTTGSPHVVIPTGSLPDDDGFKSISSKLEHDPRFPQRTSVIWAARDDAALRIRIWERGVGETQGCGTGSAAAAIDWMRRRNQGGTILVHNPGGTVSVTAERWDAPITLTGQADVLFEGRLNLAPLGLEARPSHAVIEPPALSAQPNPTADGK